MIDVIAFIVKVEDLGLNNGSRHIMVHALVLGEHERARLVMEVQGAF